MKTISFIAAALALTAAACTPAPAPTADKKADAGAVCGKDDPRLTVTGLCQAEAAKLLTPARAAPVTGDLPEGCTYVISETPTPDANEAILYRALSCKGKTTQLEFSGGARSASLGWGVSGFFDDPPTAGQDGSELVLMFPLEGVADPKKMILDMAKGTAKEQRVAAAEIAACELRPAGEGFPADAFIVDVNDAYQKAKKLGKYDTGPKDDASTGVYGACGAYGITDAQVFWMIRDGYAWFVDQGQDTPDFDAGSLTIVRKGEKGWARGG